MASEENIVSYTMAEIDAMIANGEDLTDWARVDAMTEEEREAAIDFEDEGEFDPDSGSSYTIWDGETISIRLDNSTIAWFREAVAGTGYGYKTRVADVLRAYVAEQRALAVAATTPGDAPAADPAPPPPATDLPQQSDGPLRRAS